MGELVRAMTADGFVKAVAVTTTDIVEKARQMHKTLPTATAALGRLLSAASMMGNMQKVENGSITLQVKGGGPLGTVLAVSDAEGNVRGYVQHPQISLMEKYRGKLDVGGAVGTDGMLTVIRDLQMKEPYVGSVQLVSGEIAEDITEYFVQSEQTPTACALGVLVDRDYSIKRAGGYIISLLPGVNEETITQLEICIARAKPVTTYLDQGYTLREMMEQVLSGFDCNFLLEEEVGYRCTCSRERVREVLLSLGREELEKLHREQDTAEVNCQFCDEVYRFTYEDIEDLLKETNA